MRILISGATGFVGSAIAGHLLAEGHSVRAMSRSTARAIDRFNRDAAAQRPSGAPQDGHESAQGTHESAQGAQESAQGAQEAAPDKPERLREERLTFVEADVTSPATLGPAVADVDVVIQAAQFTGAPVENPARGLTYMNVDRDGTLNLLGAITAIYGVPTMGPAMARFPHGAPRFLYVSGISVSADGNYPWNRAKWQAEEAIRGSGLDWTIVRCCWAYGPKDSALNRILGYSDVLPFVPVFGNGRQALTPIFVEDIGRFFSLLVAHPDLGRDTTFGLGGPDSLTLDGFLRLALKAMGRRRPILHIPKALGKIQGAVMQHLPGRPLTPDAVDFVAQPGAVTEADRALLAERFPGFAATATAAALAGYLGR